MIYLFYYSNDLLEWHLLRVTKRVNLTHFSSYCFWPIKNGLDWTDVSLKNGLVLMII